MIAFPCLPFCLYICQPCTYILLFACIHIYIYLLKSKILEGTPSPLAYPVHAAS
jgi:hypothetical protein